jgi:hypothetical protein
VHTHRYRIIVAGGLSEIGREAFSGFRIEANGTNTALVRDLDQRGLHAVLDRVRALGLELVEITQAPPSSRSRSGGSAR